jgi:hypothetical protein
MAFVFFFAFKFRLCFLSDLPLSFHDVYQAFTMFFGWQTNLPIKFIFFHYVELLTKGKKNACLSFWRIEFQF